MANEQAEAVSLKVAAGTGRSNRLGDAKLISSCNSYIITEPFISRYTIRYTGVSGFVLSYTPHKSQ